MNSAIDTYNPFRFRAVAPESSLDLLELSEVLPLVNYQYQISEVN
jgi:hypothetical protein